MDLNDFRNPKLIVLTATPHATNCYMAFKKSKNENSKKKLLITKISDIDFKIEDNKHSKIYSSIANPKVRKPKNSPFSLHPGKAKIYGFIKNGWRSCITQIYNNLIKNCSCLLIYKQLKINSYAGAKDKLRKNYQLID